MIINWTEPALANLDAVFAYLNHEAPIYAQTLVQDLMDSVDRLEQFPDSGRRVPEARRDDIREVICHGYRILYWRADEQRIDILGVKNSRQDLSLPANQPWDAH